MSCLLFSNFSLELGVVKGGMNWKPLQELARTNSTEMEEMSEDHEIKVGNKIEPIIFQPQRKIKLSRSTYKVTSYVDFKPYKQAFKQFGQYIRKFLADLRDPHYVNTL